MLERILIVLALLPISYGLFYLWRKPVNIKKINLNELDIEPSDSHFIQFSADWCPPCRVLKPQMKALAEAEGIPYTVVDVDTNPDLAAKYGIRSIPQVFYTDSDGKVLGHWNKLPKVEELALT